MEVNTTSTVDPVNMYNNLNNFILNPTVFIIVFLIIVAYFVLFYSLGNNEISSNSGTGQNIMSMIIVGILILLIITNVFQYFFNVNIKAYISGLFTPDTKVEIVVDQTNYDSLPIPKIKFKKQVFNIPGNYYDYENAKAICNAYNSKLATYDQIEYAYKNGAEWCNYGWSDEQMALFPTQQKTYDNLQKIPDHKHDCGRPGINGGYMANPKLKFGVNCYGNKPKIRSDEEEYMKNVSPYPKTEKDHAFQSRVDYWKNKIGEILVSPFNYNEWSET